MKKKNNYLALFCSTMAISFITLSSVATSAPESKIAVVVNTDVITREDIHKRAALILLSTGKDPSAIDQSLLTQVKEALIQEKLQRQIAKRLKISVEQDELNQALTKIASENNMTLEQMKTHFQEKGVSVATLAERIKSTLLWMKTVRSAFSHQIRISDREVQAEKKKISDNESKKQMLLSEIVLFIENPNRQHHTRSEINTLYSNLKSGTPFNVVARNFSQSPSSAQGGMVGWMAQDFIPQAAQKLDIGQYSEPILQGNRYVIYFCNDLKLPGKAPASESTISFMTARFQIAEDSEVLPESINTFMANAQQLQGCPVIKEVAQANGAQIDENKDVPLTNLHPEMQKIIQSVKAGTVTPPVRISPTEVMVSALCSQKTPGPHKLPDDQEIKLNLMEKKIHEQAIAQFNKIKSTATIEYRDAR